MSPDSGKYKTVVNRQHIHVDEIKKNFLKFFTSATAPIKGETKETIIAVIAIPFVHNFTPITSLLAITFVKKEL